MIAAVLFFLLLLTPSTSLAQDVEMSNHETHFSYQGKTNGPRAGNIELAASLLNGSVIESGAEWSFNQAVGPRNERHGFQKAKVIHRRRLKKDFGGGVCQVASTVHAAALKAGMAIVEHHPHSRASSYIHPSLDATVVWGQRDFRFVNPHTFPVTILASVQESVSSEGKPQKTIKITFVGEKKSDILVYFQIQEVKDFETLTLYRKDWKPGRRKVQEPGTQGYRLSRVRVFTQPDRSYVEERRDFTYAPSRRIIILGIGDPSVAEATP